jgi:hypothetical protein
MDHRTHHDTYEQDYLAWYLRSTDTTGEPFDPSLLVQLAYQQWKDHPKLVVAFARCTAQWPSSAYYTYLLAPAYHQERWRFAGSLFLDHPTWGTLAVDVLHDTNSLEGFTIGGIEFLDRVMGRATSAGAMNSTRLRMQVVHRAQYPTN